MENTEHTDTTPANDPLTCIGVSGEIAQPDTPVALGSILARCSKSNLIGLDSQSAHMWIWQHPEWPNFVADASGFPEHVEISHRAAECLAFAGRRRPISGQIRTVYGGCRYAVPTSNPRIRAGAGLFASPRSPKRAD